MFYAAANAYQRFLALVLIVALSAEAITGQTIKKCAENNEYCQNHWDCCSNSCLSYLYRCVRSYNVYPYPFLGVTHISTVTLDDIIAQNFGPQGAVAKSSSAAPSLSSDSVQGPMFASRFNDDNSIDTEQTTAPVDIVLQEQKEEPAAVTTTSDMPTESTTMKPDGDCKEIGSKCYRNSECCTQRCHGFLHQCVT